MANQILNTTVVGYYRGSSGVQMANAAGFTVGLGTSLIRSIEPFLGTTQPVTGATVLSVIKMARNATSTQTEVWLSTVALATNITNAT